MKLAYTIMAGRVIRDSITLKFSFIDIFDSFTIPKEVTEITQFFSVAGRILNILPGPASVDVELVHEDGTLMAKENVKGNFTAGNVTFTANFYYVKVSKLGRYFIRLNYNNGKAVLEDKENCFFDVLKAS